MRRARSFAWLVLLLLAADVAAAELFATLHRTSYWKDFVEFSNARGTPESAIALLVSNLRDSTRFDAAGERQSEVGTAVMISRCHALTNRHLVFDQPNRSRAELRNAAANARLMLVAGRGADGRPLVKRARPIQFGDPGYEGLANVRYDWALLEVDDCFAAGEVEPAALLAATPETYSALGGKLKCAAFPIENLSWDRAVRGEHKLVGTDGASIVGELAVGGYVHDCGSKPGFSGMPIYTVQDGRMLVIALNVGTLRNQPDYSRPMGAWDPAYANVAAPVSGMLRTIHSLVLERLRVKRIQGS